MKWYTILFGVLIMVSLVVSVNESPEPSEQIISTGKEVNHVSEFANLNITLTSKVRTDKEVYWTDENITFYKTNEGHKMIPLVNEASDGIRRYNYTIKANDTIRLLNNKAYIGLQKTEDEWRMDGILINFFKECNKSYSKCRTTLSNDKKDISVSFRAYDSDFESLTNVDIVDISICGVLNQNNTIYNLTKDLDFTEDCFFVEAENTTLEGNGFTVNGDCGAGVGTDFAYSDLEGHFGSVIRNINFNCSDTAISFDGGRNQTVVNVSISLMGSNSISVSGSDNVTITNSDIDRSGRIRVQGVRSGFLLENSNITNGNIQGALISGGERDCLINNFWYNNSDHIVYSNNPQLVLIEGNIMLDSRDDGIVIGTGGNHTIVNNIINGSVNKGIYLLSSTSDNTIIGNELNNNGDGIYLSPAHDNIFKNNTMTNQSIGVFLSGSLIQGFSNGNVFYNTTIYNCTTTTKGCIQIFNSNNTVFKDFLVNGSRDNMVYINLSTPTNFTDGEFTGGYLGKGFDFDGSGDYISFATLTDVDYSLVDFTETIRESCSLIRQWYYRAYVNDTSGNPIGNVKVTGYNVSSDLQFNLTTHEPSVELVTCGGFFADCGFDWETLFWGDVENEWFDGFEDGYFYVYVGGASNFIPLNQTSFNVNVGINYNISINHTNCFPTGLIVELGGVNTSITDTTIFANPIVNSFEVNAINTNGVVIYANTSRACNIQRVLSISVKEVIPLGGYTNITPITEYVNNGGIRSYYSNYSIYAINNNTCLPSLSQYYNVTGNNLEHTFTLCSGTYENWYVTDTCSLETPCYIQPYKVRVTDGGRLRINQGGYLRADGCFVEAGAGLFVNENSGGLYCES